MSGVSVRSIPPRSRDGLFFISKSDTSGVQDPRAVSTAGQLPTQHISGDYIDQTSGRVVKRHDSELGMGFDNSQRDFLNGITSIANFA
jgi:hypothetical protein